MPSSREQRERISFLILWQYSSVRSLKGGSLMSPLMHVSGSQLNWSQMLIGMSGSLI